MSKRKEKGEREGRERERERERENERRMKINSHTSTIMQHSNINSTALSILSFSVNTMPSPVACCL
jgi:hypothetical protein